MLPLLILLSLYLVSLLISKWRGRPDPLFPGLLAMSGMLLFTATGHFLYPQGMSMMLPPVIPFREELVLLTGLLEAAAAVGLLTKKYTERTAWGLIVFFVLVLPANLYAAWQRVNYQEADFTGPGPAYLWFRIPLQLLFIGWVYYFGIARKRKNPRSSMPSREVYPTLQITQPASGTNAPQLGGGEPGWGQSAQMRCPFLSGCYLLFPVPNAPVG